MGVVRAGRHRRVELGPDRCLQVQPGRSDPGRKRRHVDRVCPGRARRDLRDRLGSDQARALDIFLFFLFHFICFSPFSPRPSMRVPRARSRLCPKSHVPRSHSIFRERVSELFVLCCFIAGSQGGTIWVKPPLPKPLKTAFFSSGLRASSSAR